jgi:glutamate N-acetyltransferase/amino-acid N-acetyltransferase
MLCSRLSVPVPPPLITQAIGAASMTMLLALMAAPAFHAPLPWASTVPPTLRRSPARMAETVFTSQQAYEDSLGAHELPAGFRVGVAGFTFSPVEVEGSSAVMNLTLIALDKPTEDWAAVFTRNRFPGSPVKVGKARLAAGSALQAVVVNNKISNVCAAGDGVAASEEVCRGAAEVLGLAGGSEAVLPLSTGVIGWRLPVEQMVGALPQAAAALATGSALPAAKSIMTTDRFPKLRSAKACGGSLVGFVKGAGMIEPDMATMLAFVLTDVVVPRAALQPMLRRVADRSFNCASVDSDQSTSDSFVCLSSGAAGGAPLDAAGLEEFEAELTAMCELLSQDLVRNGEGTTHVIRVRVDGAPSEDLARNIGKAVVNSPLFKSAIAGNDPNVGRLVSSVGDFLGRAAPDLPLDACSMRFGGRTIFENGAFAIDPASEDAIHEQLLDSLLTGDNKESLPYPPHERCVEIEVSLGAGNCACTVHGSDLTQEYVSINADYRS